MVKTIIGGVRIRARVRIRAKDRVRVRCILQVLGF